MSRSRDFCFTLNNPDIDEALATLRSIDCRYIVYGSENAPETGTHHFQGYVAFRNPKTISACSKLLHNAHVEIRKSSPKEASDYCKKDGEFEERGVLPMSQTDKGQSSKDQWDYVLQLAAEDRLDECPPEYFIRYHSTLNKIAEECRFKRTRFTLDSALRPWQQQLVDELNGAANDRKVIWYVDSAGGAGKTYLTKYLVQERDAFALRASKAADMAHYIQPASIYIFDFPRAVEEHPPYAFLESVKDGMVFSPKYDSHMKFIRAAHVIVFANWEPDRTKLSTDRWDIRFIENA